MESEAAGDGSERSEGNQVLAAGVRCVSRARGETMSGEKKEPMGDQNKKASRLIIQMIYCAIICFAVQY